MVYNYHRDAWKYQNELQNKGHIHTQSELHRVAQTFNIPQEKTLFLLTYLTGGRISEVLQIKKENIEIVDTFPKKFMRIHMVNKKRRKISFKIVPVPLHKEHLLAEPIIKQLNTGKNEFFKFKTTARAWQIMRKVKINPHWLRHLRLTHLYTLYRFNDVMVQKWAGWKDTRQAARYAEYMVEDMMDAL